MMKDDRGKPTLWLGNGGTGNWNGQGVDVESAKDDGGESGFGEHDGRTDNNGTRPEVRM